MIGVFTGFAVAQTVGELNVVSKDLENILGRKPTTIAEFLKSVYRA
jgi:NAD(P)H dehydrogenase (quinone)